MAGNIVKWWRQFKQYKQFSVLQECPTDSEELLYKAQIPTNAPPDIVLTSHRSKTNVQFPTTTKGSHTIEKKIITQENHTPPKPNKKPKELRANQLTPHEKERLQKRHSIATTQNLEQLEASRVKLNELSCDVSFNDTPKSPQPVQFSFTLYGPLDGHGKISKDDIAGIVSTIYESIGNNVTVSNYGKKTINVKLTVAPDAKSNDLLNANRRSFRSRYGVKASLSEEENDSETASENYENHFKISSSGKCEHSKDVKMNIYESVKHLNRSNLPLEEEEVYVENIQKDFAENRLHIEEEETVVKTHQKQFIGPSKKKILRKQRRKQRNNNEATRGRSLSVGNDCKWRKNKEAERDECEVNETMRKHELIEIIRESMEKNRLCFQNKRKLNIEGRENQTRPRSNTVTCTKEAKNLKNCSENDQHHLCAFDSFLHSTICSNLNSFSKIDSSKNNSFRGVGKNKNLHETSVTPVLKLKSSVLNQLDQNLTPEQKLTRKLNDVEKWLYERERQDVRHKTREDKILTQQMTENFHSRVSSTPKKSLKENIAMKKNNNPAPHHLKQHKEVMNSTRNKAKFDYSVNASDCENLISMSEEEQPLLFQKSIFEEESPLDGSETASKSSSVRFVHIHHHFYHFENNGKFE